MIQVRIQKPTFLNEGDTIKIYIIDEEGRKRTEITQDKDSKFLHARELDPNQPNKIEPFLELPEKFFNEIAKSIVEYANVNDIKTDNESVLQGKLTATEKHLEDLRNYFDRTLTAALNK
jgi:hypothetical protein